MFVQDVNGDKVPERKPDGVHVCPSGAAMYALWLTDQLQQRFADFVPAPAAEWATGEWVDDPRYTQPEGICADCPSPARAGANRYPVVRCHQVAVDIDGQLDHGCR